MNTNTKCDLYVPTSGFFDIAIRPKTLSKREHEKLIYIQKFIIEQNKNSEYLKNHDKRQWDLIRETSAKLQQIVLKHWKDSVFEKECGK